MNRGSALTAPKAPAKRLRRDAQRNRDAIVAAACEAFAEQGLGASLEGIARQADIAIGTLYRHFPTRLALVEELFAEKFARLLAASEEAAAMDDAWLGFCAYLEKVCELQACDRAFNDLTSARLPHHAFCSDTIGRVRKLGAQIIENAQRQGSLRGDVTEEDLAFVVWSLAGIIQATRTAAPDAWRRYLHLMLDAFRADGAHELPVPPLTPDQREQAQMTALECSGDACDECREID